MTSTPASTLERRFHASVLLVEHFLRKVSESVELERQLAFARSSSMFRECDEAFYRRCRAVDAALQEGSGVPEPITEEHIAELQACAMRLNVVEAA